MQILGIQVWGTFTTRGGHRAWTYLNTLEKATTLCSWLLTAPAIPMAHGHSEGTWEQKEEEKDPHFQWQLQHSTSLNPREVQSTSAFPAFPTPLWNTVCLTSPTKCTNIWWKQKFWGEKSLKFHKPEFFPLRRGREKCNIPYTVNPKGLSFARKQFKCFHIPNNKTTDS